MTIWVLCCVFVAPEPIKRMPTDMIPDTADSSPLVSRGHSKYSLRSQPYIELEEDSDSEEEEVELEVKEEENRLKVVSLFYRAHEGVPAQEPYNIKAKQLVGSHLLVYCPFSWRQKSNVLTKG